MTHQDFANFSESWGLVFLMACFCVAILYALWPKNRDKFDDAAHRPLDEE